MPCVSLCSVCRAVYATRKCSGAWIGVFWTLNFHLGNGRLVLWLVMLCVLPMDRSWSHWRHWEFCLSQDCTTWPHISKSLRRQGLPKSGLQPNKKFMTLLLAGNASVSSVAFENEVGGVLSQGTSVTSLVPYCYGKFLFTVVSQAHRCTHSLYGFLVCFPRQWVALPFPLMPLLIWLLMSRSAVPHTYL